MAIRDVRTRHSKTAAERTKSSDHESLLLVSTNITWSATNLQCRLHKEKNRANFGIVSVLHRVSIRPPMLQQCHD